jgi:membrane protein implicated in regulation of membrane protease activity
MQWWAWIALGALLLGAELTLINAQFYLVFAGLAAIIVGLMAAGGVPGSDWAQWLVFAALAVASMLTFRRQIYERMRRRLPPVGAGPAGEMIDIPTALAPGESCRLEYRGASWSALNGGNGAIPAGAAARIVRVDGLTLIVRSL